MGLKYSKQARKYLLKMPPEPARAIRQTRLQAAADFDGFSGDLVKMAGSDCYRLRVGR